MSRARDIANFGNGIDAADITDATITAGKLASGAVEGALVTATGRRNLIINGAMQVAQRGTSFTVTNEYGIDRWFCRENTDGALTFSQDSESPAGFSKSIKVNVNTADLSLDTSQFAYLAQRIEGYNIEPLAFGSSSAKSVTLSFYVRCSVTGKFGGAITNGSSNNRAYSFTYDIDAANTWERKTLTISGDTAGTWPIDSANRMVIFLSLGGGSGVKTPEGSWVSGGYQSATEANVDLIENASATFYITGVQLEVGSVATPFEHRSYGEELALCQRYYQIVGYYDTVGSTGQNTMYHASRPLTVAMRTSPSLEADYLIGTLTGRAMTRVSSTQYDGFNFVKSTPTMVCVRGATASIFNTIYGDSHWSAEL